MRPATPKIAFLRKASLNGQAKALVAQFTDTHALLSQKEDFDIVVIDQPGALASMSLKVLRLNPRYRFKLIYSRQQDEPTVVALSDGVPPARLDDMRGQWTVLAERLSAFNRGSAPESLETRVMAYLWMRESAQLSCVNNPKLNQHYHLPLVEAMMGSEKVNPFAWLNLMQNKGLIEAGEILDRIRLCKGCGSGRLNYVDICPECTHLDIKRQPAIHCFTCGHVGNQDKFLKAGVMACPNCQTRLRHIGADYDRPMENYSCGDCHAFFVDPKVEARCLDCGECHDPSDLRIQMINDYTLTEKARMLCRNGLFFEQDISERFTQGNFTSFDAFKELLDWQIQMSRRYPDASFSLLGIHLENLSTVIGRLGCIKGNAFSDTLVDRISSMLRETDRACRSLDDHIWILLPHTDEKGARNVEPRIHELAKLFKSTELQALKIKVVKLGKTPKKGFTEDAELLLARVQTEAEPA